MDRLENQRIELGGRVIVHAAVEQLGSVTTFDEERRVRWLRWGWDPAVVKIARDEEITWESLR